MDSVDLEYAKRCLLFVSLLNSVMFDFITRLKMSENLLKSTLCEIATPSPENLEDRFLGKAYSDFILPRSYELSYVTYSLNSIASHLGFNKHPFRWEESRRFLLRCELDSAYFHLYGISREDIEYIMETFPIVKRRDEEQYGEYRTKRVILEIYDEIAEAMRTGKPYQTRLDPPPADPRVAHKS